MWWEVKSRAILSATSLALIFVSEFRLSKGVGEKTSDTSSARQLRFACRNPTVRATFLARQSSPLPRRIAIPGKPRRFRSVCVHLSNLSELLKVRGGQGDGDPLQVGTTCEVFQAFIIKTKVCSQFYLENRTHISLRTRILTNSEFYMWPTTYNQPGTSLLTPGTPVVAAQAWPPNTGLNTNHNSVLCDIMMIPLVRDASPVFG